METQGWRGWQRRGRRQDESRAEVPGLERGGAHAGQGGVGGALGPGPGSGRVGAVGGAARGRAAGGGVCGSAASPEPRPRRLRLSATQTLLHYRGRTEAVERGHPRRAASILGPVRSAPPGRLGYGRRPGARASPGPPKQRRPPPGPGAGGGA